MRYFTKLSLLLLVLLLGIYTPASAQQVGSCEPAIGEAYLDINNVRARILNNGNLFWRGDPHVYEVPQGSGETSIFASGIWLGGKIGGKLHLAGSTYGPFEFWAGPLDPNGNPPASCDAYDRIWKVSKAEVIAFEGGGPATPDLQTWPTGLGAPTFYTVDTDTGSTEVLIELQADGTLAHLVTRDNGQVEIIQTENLSFQERIQRTINLGAGERPKILGDQMLWWIMNDMGNAHARTNGLPIGLEVHASAFAFNTAGAIGNTTFYRYRMFYKGSEPLEETFMGIFVDPDLGNFDDDYVGSDTTLGLGFVYNADNDDEGHYGTPPPALGYDFFQGPIVPSPGDTALVSGRRIPNFKNLDMTAFVYYNNGSCVTCDPQTAEEYYNYMQARWRDGQRITFGGNGRDFSNIPTNFMFPGSPSTQEFWSEINADGQGNANEPADRRFVMATGPFTINPGDMQEIVFGIVWSRGSDNLDSVAKLKADDALAQAVFDINFELPAPPAAPEVVATPLDGKVILEWNNPPSSNNYLETYQVIDPLLSPDVADRDYVFEGYNVYRFDSPQDQTGTLLATYDVVNGITRVIEGDELTFVTAEGTDRGVQRFHVVDGLTNYQTYFFGVQAYAYNAESGQKVYAGPITRVEVVPTPAAPREGGTLLSEDAVDKAFVEQTTAECAGTESSFDICAEKDGQGGGLVTADVVNPAAVTGHTYRVEFFQHCLAGKNTQATVEAEEVPEARRLAKGAAEECFTTYDIVDVTTGEKKFDGAQAVEITGKGAPQGAHVQVVDGLSFSISGPPPEFLGMTQLDQPLGAVIDSNVLLSLNAASQRQAGGVSFYVDAQGNSDHSVAGAIGRMDWVGGVAASAPREFEIRFVENPETNGQVAISGWTGGRGDGMGFIMRGWIEGENQIFNEDGTLNPVTFDVGRLPFQVWEIDPLTGTETQVVYAILDDDDDGFWAPIRTDATFAPFADGSRSYERIYATNIPYDEAQLLANPDDISTQDLFWNCFPDCHTFGRVLISMWANADGNISAAPPSPGTVLRLVTSKPNLPGDVFTVNTDGLGVIKGDRSVAENELERIGITPNPYKGASLYETSRFNDEVRFTNMPEQATIRIFTLNGTLIRTLRKNSPEAFFTWDLTTEEGLPIASGMYLIHVEVPGLGEKVLKFAVIKKRIQLNTF